MKSMHLPTWLRRSRAGFSLVEVLVAIVIVAFTVVGLFSLLPLTTKMMANTDTRETVKDLATMQLEYVKSLPWSDSLSYSLAPIPSEYTGYSASLNAAPLADPALQQITVSVTHTIQNLGTPGSTTQTATLTGYKGNW